MDCSVDFDTDQKKRTSGFDPCPNKHMRTLVRRHVTTRRCRTISQFKPGELVSVGSDLSLKSPRPKKYIW